MTAGGDFARTERGIREKPHGNAIRGLFRDRTGLLHLAWMGEPACGFDGKTVDAIHPADRAALWCSRCMDVLVAKFPRQKRDLRG